MSPEFFLDSFFRDHYLSRIWFANSLWIKYLFPEFTLNTLYFSRNNYESLINFIQYPLRASFIFFAHSLFFHEIIICFAQTLYREYTTSFANSLSASRIHYLFRALNIVSANSLSFSLIHYLLRAFTIFFPILLFFLRIRYRRI